MENEKVLKNGLSIALIALSIILVGCGKKELTTNNVSDKGATSEETVKIEENEYIEKGDNELAVSEENNSEKEIDEKKIIENACTWLSVDIKSHTVEYRSYALFGKTDIDLEFDYELFKESMKDLDKYNEQINSLPDEYSKIKESWNLSIEQLKILNEQIENVGIAELGEFDDSKLNQYSDALFNYARPIVYGE